MPRKRNPETAPCKHCAHRAGYRKQRGLCQVCYKTPEVRDLYPKRGLSMEQRRAMSDTQFAKYHNLPRCCHCNVYARMKRAKGLCKHCYDTPEIRAKYPGRVQRIQEGTHHSSTPTFPWSGQDDLFPCDRCVKGAADRPRGLCPSCDKLYPDWQPKEDRPVPPVRLCLQVCEVGR